MSTKDYEKMTRAELTAEFCELRRIINDALDKKSKLAKVIAEKLGTEEEAKRYALCDETVFDILLRRDNNASE